MNASRSSKLVVLLLVLFLSFASSALAQVRKATITGHAFDSSGGVLQGAKVVLEPIGATAVSNAQGVFFINNLTPGSYTLTITYVGFTVFTQEVELSASQTSTIDGKLAVQSQDQQVLVTAGRASAEAEAINRERTADNLVQILPDDVIRSLPNANMAVALGRLPSVTLERDEGEGKYVQIRGTEPRLTNVTIDGMNVPSPESGVRQIKLDSIPADIVESVEINKTLQANMDGDGIGGSVNLVTKTAGERPTIALSGMGGYTPIIGGLVETTGTVGQRFGHDKKFGALIGGSYDWNGRGIDDLEPVPDIATFPDGSQQRYFDATDIREYRYYRSRWGLAGSSDYQLGNGSNVYIRGLFSNFKNYGDRWVYSINDNTPNILLLNSNGGTPSFNNEIRRPNIGIGSILLGGKHVLTNSWISWDASVSRSHLTEENAGSASFSSTLASSSCQFDPSATANIYRPQFTPACFSEAYNPANMTLDEIDINRGLTAQLNLQFTGAVARRYHIGSRLATIEVGGKFRNAHEFDGSFDLATTPNGVVPLSQFPNRFTNNNYYFGAYQLGPNPNYQDVIAFANANPNAFQTISDQFQNPSNFDLVEKVSAGYVMNTIDFTSRIRVVAGVRFEGTNLETDHANGSYLNVLPSVSLRYALTGNTDLRLAYGRGLARPDPQDIAREVAVTFVAPGDPRNSASLGNPNLKAETANNFDLLIEHYLNPFGQIQAGVFYKNLTDPIVNQSFQKTFQPTPTTPLDTYTVTQSINAGSAWLTGFEAAYLQHFSFLPGKLGGLGISANYGYTSSRTSGIPGRSDHPRLLRSAPDTWNLSPTYDRGRFSIRVGLSYNQANIFSYQFSDGLPGGLKGPLSDTYLYTHLQFDAQGSMRLSHGLSFVMYGLNLNNEVFGFYNGSPQYMIQREYYSPTVAAGFRWSPVRE